MSKIILVIFLQAYCIGTLFFPSKGWTQTHARSVSNDNFIEESRVEPFSLIHVLKNNHPFAHQIILLASRDQVVNSIIDFSRRRVQYARQSRNIRENGRQFVENEFLNSLGNALESVWPAPRKRVSIRKELRKYRKQILVITENPEFDSYELDGLKKTVEFEIDLFQEIKDQVSLKAKPEEREDILSDIERMSRSLDEMLIFLETKMTRDNYLTEQY